MKSISFKRTVLQSVLSLFASGLWAANQVDPSAFSMKFYETRVSPHANCSGGFITVFQSFSPAYQDMLAGPTLGSGAVPLGTYNCLAFRISDVIRYTPVTTTTGGHCVGGTPYSKDIAHGEITTSPDGASIATVNGAEDLAWIYLSTSGSDTNTCFTPAQACRLTTPLLVSLDHTGSFISDARGGVEDLGPGNCSLETVHFYFR